VGYVLAVFLWYRCHGLSPFITSVCLGPRNPEIPSAVSRAFLQSHQSDAPCLSQVRTGRRAAASILGLVTCSPCDIAFAAENKLWGKPQRFADWDTSKALERLLKECNVRNLLELPEKAQLAFQVWSIALENAVDLPERLQAVPNGRSWWEGVLLEAARSETTEAAAIRSVLQSLGDRYARYIAPEDWGQQENIYAGEPAIGFGVAFVLEPVRPNQTAPKKTLPPGPDVLFVQPGSAAEAAGVQRGDVLMEIDGHFIGRAIDPDRYIFGPINSTAEVKLLRPSDNFVRSYFLPRVPTAIEPVDAAPLGQHTGYVYISTFQPPLESPLAKALGRALGGLELVGNASVDLASSARGLVVDLRGNGGGRLSQADKAAALVTQAAQDANVPVAILVDEGTASASEALAVSLRDKFSARIIGSGSWRTAGKGEEQVSFELLDGSAVVLSVDRWAPRGFKGVLAEEICGDVVGYPSARTAKEDPCVAAALRMLNS